MQLSDKIKALKQFSAAVGLKVKVVHPVDCVREYEIWEVGEKLFTALDTYDVEDAIVAYGGSHENFKEAERKYRESFPS